jgi:ribosomal protein S18 acetylase RimI-like enzyme
MGDKKLNLRFRQSRPADVEQAVPLIYSAGVEAFDYMFRQGSAAPLRFLGCAFTEGSGFFGCRVHTVVELEDRVVGIGASYSGAQFDRLALGTTRQVFQFYGLARCWSVFRRMLYCKRIMPRPGWRTEYVADLAVRPDMQDSGVGTALLRHYLAVARTKGQRACALDVALNNPRAQALYERFGFKVVRENCFGRSGEVPDSRRMEMLV